LNEDERKMRMSRLVGQTISLKVIEVNRKRRRLVFSQRDANRGTREQRKEVLLDQLHEGETRKGTVSGLRDFGAFVDLGGADGLIHISELAWHRVNHPREVLKVGDEVEVYILRLDAEGKRIGLSLKRLQENPWAMVEEMYHIGQLVSGVVSRVAQFGAFVSLDPGIEALLHTSQIAEPPPEDPTLVVHEGQHLLMRVISVEAEKQRLGLSLKEVSEEEKARWRESRAAQKELAEDLQDEAQDAAQDEFEDAPEAVLQDEPEDDVEDMPEAVLQDEPQDDAQDAAQDAPEAILQDEMQDDVEDAPEAALQGDGGVTAENPVE
jgi:small subunit ribosomal protein S1